MRLESVRGARIAGVAASLPARTVDPVARLVELTGDAARAASVVATTGIASLRVAEPDTAPVDLCVAAAERLLAGLSFDRTRIGAVVFVSFTSPQAMPAAAAAAQARLGLSGDVQALDVGLACSGFVHGLYLSGLLAGSTGRAVLLLDGDVQSRVIRPDDESTAPILSDAGTATLVVPDDAAGEWTFAFLTKGSEGAALTRSAGGPIEMDGLGVFRFVSADVARFLGDFLRARGRSAADYDAFVPHQPNVYLVRRLAKALGFDADRTWISADRYGNSASATVPVTLADVGCRAQGTAAADSRLLLAGFGGGLAAAAADICLPANALMEI